jgi:hypothetical protein
VWNECHPRNQWIFSRIYFFHEVSFSYWKDDWKLLSRMILFLLGMKYSTLVKVILSHKSLSRLLSLERCEMSEWVVWIAQENTFEGFRFIPGKITRYSHCMQLTMHSSGLFTLKILQLSW